MAGKYKKIVIVTGGSSGIGRCTASALRDSGCIVYEFSRRNIPMEGITHLSVDVTDENAVNSAVKQIIQKETKIDAVINCAGFGISGAVEFAYYVGSSTYGTIQNKMQNLQSDGKAITVYTKLRYIFSRIFPDLKWCKFYAPTVYKYPVLLPFFWVWRLLVKGFKKRNIVKCELESIKNAK